MCVEVFICLILHSVWRLRTCSFYASSLWNVVLFCHQYDICKNYVGGYGGLIENGLCVFRELCPVSFLVVGESPPFFVVCSRVVC